MCSIQLSEIEDLQNKFSPKIGSLCTKCSEKAVVIIRGIDPLCKKCFLAYFVHKFRAVLGKSKLIQSGEKVLVAHSGGPSSSAMVHLVYEGVTEQNYKKLRFQPSIVFIDEGAVIDLSEEERMMKCQEVLDLITYANFTCYVTTLEMIFELNDCDGDSGNFYVIWTPGTKLSRIPSSAKARDQLQAFMSSVKTLTAKLDLIERFRHKLLYKIATHVGHTKILFGESATRLAVRLLANMAQGRGAHLPLDTKFLDYRHERILFLRPMRELSIKEIVFYNVFQNLQAIIIQNLSTGTFPNSCIQRLTETFVYSLQSEFFSTVSTIVKTGDKLSLEDKLDKNELCLLCQAPLDTETSESSALVATQLSKALSQEKCKSSSGIKDNLLEPQHCKNKDCDDGGECVVISSIGLLKDQLNQLLCYGCRIIIQDMGAIDPLPEFIQQQACKKIQRTQMKEQIKEYLLDDSEG